MKILFVIITFVLLTGFVYGQKVSEADVPAAVKSELKSLYSGITGVKWEKEKGNYEANFKQGTTEMSVTINPTGELLETETSIPASSLPKAATGYLAKNLPGKKIKEASQIKDAKGIITFEGEVDGMDYVFDSKGNFIKKEVDND